MTAGDVIAALEPVVAILRALGVRYRIGGSVASSVLGVPRSTLDADLVCELAVVHVGRFVAALADAYYVDADMIRDAIGRRASFNLVHLSTMIKVDVFIRKESRFDRAAFERVIRKPIDESPGAPELDITTAEDIVLHKLRWYRLGDEVSERQWKDAVGVLKVQREAIDRDYLRRWAQDLDVEDLLDRAMRDAGLTA